MADARLPELQLEHEHKMLINKYRQLTNMYFEPDDEESLEQPSPYKIVDTTTTDSASDDDS